MRATSAKPPHVVSATEARRRLSAILDGVERGREFVVERHGRRVCLLTPAPVAGRRGSECLARLQGRAPVLLDDRFGHDLLEVIAGGLAERDPGDS